MDKKTIILAAGMGTRLKPLTLETHKCMTLVNETPILFNALGNLQSIGVKNVVIVVGYLADQIQNQVGNSYMDLHIKYVVNDRYEETNTSYSLKLGLEASGEYETLYLLEGDVFFEKNLLDLIDRCLEENATLVEKYQPYLDGTFVDLNADSYVTEWTHKSVRKDGYRVEDKYKTINIHKFSKEFVDNILIKKVKEICEATDGSAPLEYVMESIVKENGNQIYGLECGEFKWYEIDDLQDLKRAEEIFRGVQG